MNRLRHTDIIAIHKSHRSGVTLMEVLMSVMIMSIGVISLASLFPISILRGVKATNLTNATILRYNAEALADIYTDQMIHDPDGDGNRLEHRRRGRNYVVDPLGYYFAQEDDNSATTLKNGFGNDGAGNANNRIPRFPSGFPLSVATSSFSQADSWQLLYDGIPASLNGARDTIELDPDDVLDNIIDLQQLAYELGAPVGWDLTSTEPLTNGGRLLLFDSTGKQVQVRSLTTTDQLDLTNDQISLLTPLPADGLYSSVSRMRIEIPDRRYTYLLTVRHQPISLASVDVVVFFRRNFSPEFEVIYPVENFTREWIDREDRTHTNAGVDGQDDDGDGQVDEEDEFGWPGSDDVKRRIFRLHYIPSLERPPLKKGGYIFDHQNARWYRIQNYVEDDLVSPTYADVTLDQPILESIVYPTPLPAGYSEGVMVMPNVVQVYPLGNKLDPNF